MEFVTGWPEQFLDRVAKLRSAFPFLPPKLPQPEPPPMEEENLLWDVEEAATPPPVKPPDPPPNHIMPEVGRDIILTLTSGDGDTIDVGLAYIKSVELQEDGKYKVYIVAPSLSISEM